jgi:KDO2-lipid IV(A) lauroyltransferase
VLRDNLRPLLPEAGERELRRASYDLVAQYGAYFVDLLDVYFGRRLPSAGERFESVTGGDHVRAAAAAGRGMLLVTPHLGNWELGQLVFREAGLSTAVLTAPIASGHMGRRMEEARRRLGIDVVTLARPEAYMFALKRLLGERRTVVLLGDLDRGGVGETVPFLGRNARLPTGYLHVARMFDAPVVPCFIVRSPSGRYRCAAEPPVFVRRDGDRDADVREALGRVAAVFERYIREYPLQWYRFTSAWEAPAAPRGA